MFERKDLLKASFLFLVIFVVMVTLSQILVVHKRNHGNTKSRDRQKMKAIISQIEAIISGMMRPDFIPMDKHTEVLKAIKYAAKIKRQLDKASSMQRKTMRVKLLRSEVPPTSKPAVVNTDVWNLDRKTRYLQFSDMKPSDIHQISQRDDATNLESAVTYGGGSKLTSTVMGALPTHICRPLPENMGMCWCVST
ncbi:hypothetical protein DPMN_066407 [Dreissena polymorpha]|uniref:Uncharacterized protein n=1 Tax=Dreissena polymorpha TaxID=45954 RepID=A0A9D4BST4_DREPO|nr:hypothetical protein DPMN_066407 [Dreissena polymorpha]